MAGYIGSKASVVSSGVERKKTYSITGSTTSLTGLNYTVGKVHVFQNGVRLLDGTDYTATNGTSITLTVAAQSGDNVVVVSQASFQLSEHYTSAEADAEFVTKTGDSMTGNLSFGDNDKAIFGDANELQIYNDGTHTVIAESGPGAFKITADAGLWIQSNNGEFRINTDANGAVALYYDNAVKIATTSTGIDVTGTVRADDLTIGHTSNFSNALANDIQVGTVTGSHGISILSQNNSYSSLFFSDNNNNDAGSIRYNHSNNTIDVYTDRAKRLAIDSSGNVGIGVIPESSYPDRPVVRIGSGLGLMCRATGNPSHTWINSNAYQDPTTADDTYIGTDQASQIQQANGIFSFKTAASGTAGTAITWTTAATIDASGNFLVGTTTSTLYNATSGTGLSYRNGVGLDIARENSGTGQPLINLNLTGADGDHLLFYKDGSVVGTIGTISGSFYIGTPYSNDSALRFSTNTIHPCTTTGSPRDNAIQLGYSSARFNDAFITNGVTTGSDRTEKQDIAALTDTEMLVAARLSQTFRTYRWKDAVASKGDNARTHTGTIAQEVQAAFTAEGLDAGDYGLFCSDTWWETQTEVPAVEAVAEVTDEDGNVTTEAVEAKDAYTRTDTYDTEAEAPEGATSKTRMGIRYPELLSFVAAYNEQRFASIEARLTALEA